MTEFFTGRVLGPISHNDAHSHPGYKAKTVSIAPPLHCFGVSFAMKPVAHNVFCFGDEGIGSSAINKAIIHDRAFLAEQINIDVVRPRGLNAAATKSMNVQKKITGEAHELLISGRIDGEGANQLEEQVLAAIRAGAKSIYINLSEATFLCSAGLRVLLQYWRQMKNSQKLLQATRPSPEVDAVLVTSGFREMLVEKI